jgi:glutathione peroxidase
MPDGHIYSFEVNDIDHKPVPLSQYRDKVLLVVNVASKCGFTPQYQGLEELYQELKDHGFAVLGFPCNQFGGQEPGSEEEIKTFCQLQYDVSFPLFEKIAVNGEHAHPLYRYLKKSRKGFLGVEAVKWNFTKFLIDRKGNVVERFSPSTSPGKLKAKVIECLAL